MNTTPSLQARNALAHELVVLADNKYRLGLRYAEWCNSAPTLEAAIAAAAMTQDELGHARSIYAVVRDFNNPPDEFDEDENARDTFLNMSCLDAPFTAWADFVAANSIPDQVLSVLFEAATESLYEPLAQRARKIVQEEHYHYLYAQGWCARLAANEASRAALLESAARMWPEALAWFGPATDPHLALLHEQGILDAGPQELRSRFQARVMKLLGDVPSSGDIRWDAWNAQARALLEA